MSIDEKAFKEAIYASSIYGFSEATHLYALIEAYEAAKLTHHPDEYRPHPNTSLETRIDNALHRLNLNRPDIAALKDGQTIQRNIADDRWLATLLIDIKRLLTREVVDPVKRFLDWRKANPDANKYAKAVMAMHYYFDSVESDFGVDPYHDDLAMKAAFATTDVEGEA